MPQSSNFETCSACGCGEHLHDSSGCFADANRKNRPCHDDDSFNWEPKKSVPEKTIQEQTARLRQRLRASGAMCWCTRFCRGEAEARELILESGPPAVLQTLLASCIQKKDSDTARRVLLVYLGRTVAKDRDRDWVNSAEREIADIESNLSRRSILASNIDRLRKECGWSLNDCEHWTGLDKKLIRGHISGKSARPKTLKLYAQAFSKELKRPVTVSELES